MEGELCLGAALSLAHPEDLVCFILLTCRGGWVAYLLFIQQSRMYHKWIFKTNPDVYNRQSFPHSFVAHTTVSPIVSGKYLRALNVASYE